MAGWRSSLALGAALLFGAACVAKVDGEQQDQNPPSLDRALGADEMAAQCFDLGAASGTTSLCTVDLAGTIVEMDVPLPTGHRPAL